MRLTVLLLLLLAAAGPGVRAQLEVMEVGSLIRTGKQQRLCDIRSGRDCVMSGRTLRKISSKTGPHI